MGHLRLAQDYAVCSLYSELERSKCGTGGVPHVKHVHETCIRPAEGEYYVRLLGIRWPFALLAPK